MNNLEAGHFLGVKIKLVDFSSKDCFVLLCPEEHMRSAEYRKASADSGQRVAT